MSIDWNGKGPEHIERAILESLQEFSKELDKDIKEQQVVPKDTGALEDSQDISVVNKNTVRITYSTPYATRLYYHPEYNFSQDKNKNAQGKWLDPILRDDEMLEKYANILKKKV